MFSPPHPGEFIQATYLEPFGVSQNAIADELGVARSTFNRIVRGTSNISSEMAIRLSRVLEHAVKLLSELQTTLDLFKKDLIFVKWHRPFASN